MFFCWCYRVDPSPLFSGNDKEYLAARALALTLSETNRGLTSNYKGLRQAYEELKTEGRLQEEELHQTQEALERLKGEAKGLRESLESAAVEKTKAMDALSKNAAALEKKDVQIQKLVGMVNIAKKSRATVAAERTMWKRKFLGKLLVLFAVNTFSNLLI